MSRLDNMREGLTEWEKDGKHPGWYEYQSSESIPYLLSLIDRAAEIIHESECGGKHQTCVGCGELILMEPEPPKFPGHRPDCKLDQWLKEVKGD